MASIICRYLDGTTYICDSTYSITDIKVNGTSIGITTTYDVNSTDEVEFILSTSYLSGIIWYECTGLTSVILSGLKEIDGNLFYGCTSLESVVFDNELKKIGVQVFRECTSLKSLNIPDSVISIGSQAFQDCTSIESVKLGNGVTYIDEYAFENCQALQYVEFGNSITDIYAVAFKNCISLKEIVFPDSLINIGNSNSSVREPVYTTFGAFYGCTSLESVVFNNGLKKIADYCFENCTSLKKVVIPDSVSVLGTGAFQGCTSLESVKLGNGLYVIKDVAFRYCRSLVTISIGDKIHTIGNQSFEGCDKLQRLILPPNVRTIVSYAFNNCENLIEIYVKNTSCSIGEYTFKYVKENGTLYYPTGSDYSQWLSTDPYYLGYYGWNGVPMDPEDMPDNPTDPDDPDNPDNPTDPDDPDNPDNPTDPDDPDNPDDPNAPSVGSDTRTIVFEASGGTQPIDFTWFNVSYDDISTKAEAADSWIELDYEGLISSSPIITQYLVTAGVNTGEPRTTYFTFTGSTSSGEIKTETITIYQKNNNGDLPNDSDMTTGCYINLDSYEHTFPATGGTYFVRAEFGFPAANSGLKTRVYKGAVYPIAWCATELNGGEVADDGTEGNEVWKITMLENTGDVRECSVSFSYTNSYGESTSVIFTAKQEAAEGEEDSNPTVSAFTTTAKVKADGTPEMASFTSINCGYNKVTILTPVVNGDWITLGAGSSASGTFIGFDEVRQYPISFAANEGDARTGTITFSGTDASGNTLTSICNITQAAAGTGGDDEDPEIPVAGDDYVGPIWKDIEYSFGGAEMVEYGIYSTYKTSVGNSIVDVDTLLFAGRSYRRPTNGENSIYVNKICQSYMDAPLLSEENISTGLGYGVFKLKSGDGTTTYRTYRFVNDWSYSDDFRTGLLSRPILNDNTKVFRNQWLPFTVFGANDTVNIPYGIQYGGKKDEYGVTIPDWNSTVSITNGVTTEMFPYPSRKDGAVSYTINGITYPIVDECVQYVLYYVNPWGGYDWFPIRGKVVERDLMTAYTYMQNYNNQTIEFGKKKYLADIRKQFTLHTQWMSEEESSRMWYLLQSNTVYLHNLVEDKIYPAVITNTEQEHKKRLRGQRISYQIDVELSQTRQRI